MPFLILRNVISRRLHQAYYACQMYLLVGPIANGLETCGRIRLANILRKALYHPGILIDIITRIYYSRIRASN